MKCSKQNKLGNKQKLSKMRKKIAYCHCFGIRIPFPFFYSITFTLIKPLPLNILLHNKEELKMAEQI